MNANSIPPDDSPTEVELLAEVHRLVHRTAGSRPVQRTPRWVNGRVEFDRDGQEPNLPMVGSPEWWAADERVRVASLLVLAASYLVSDPERQVRERLKSVSWDVAGGMAGTEVGPSHAELERRRGIQAPSRPVDQQAAARWARTGASGTTSEGEAA